MDCLLISRGDVAVGFFSEMYAPADWARFMQVNYTQIVDIVRAEASGIHSLARSSGTFQRRNLCVLSQVSEVLNTQNSAMARLLNKRAKPNDSPPYSIHAISCGDAIDLHGITMEEQFRGIIDNARNISHLCKWRRISLCAL